MQFKVFDTPRPKFIVISHERSGTHFLINSLGDAFGYVADPWIDFDTGSVAINYFHPPSVTRFFAGLKEINVANIFKSHHAIEFFDESLDSMTEDFFVFYIYRDPRDVMRSFWRFLHGWEWFEGPRVETVQAFMRAQPAGQLLRYQWEQKADMLTRWRDHVRGWLHAAAGNERIVPVRYESLRDDYADTINAVGERIGMRPGQLTPPPRERSVVVPRLPEHIRAAPAEFDDDDEALFRAALDPDLGQLGY